MLAAVLAALPFAAPAATGTDIVGRVLAVQGGLPIVGATVDIFSGTTNLGTTKTDASGVFTFKDEPPGTYTFTIHAQGYETTRTSDVPVSAGQTRIEFTTAINREARGLKQIAQVAVAKNSALQVSTTINTYVDTSLLTDENFQRLGDVLTTVPGVLTQTSSSVGDDMSLSIRGFDSTETATLLDGHEIGPLGAHGNGYNYNVSPFWGLQGATVVFGSGAAGVFGATTIAGGVNLQTLNPTRENQISMTQGVGNSLKAMTGLEATGTYGKWAYALAYGVQGTTGNFAPGYRLQTALLQGSAISAHQPISSNYAQPADLTTANRTAPINYYNVTGDYLQNNWVGKVSYQFGPRTSFSATSYSANDWSDSTGEGDNDYQTWQYVDYNAIQQIASLSHGLDVTKLNNGKTYVCRNSLVVLNNSPRGYTCMNAAQYATSLSGPFGGGPGRWRTLGNQDYHASLSQGVGNGTVTVDYYQDAYNNNLQKGPGYAGGPFYLNLYNTRGYQVSDQYSWARNDLSFGYDYLRQFSSFGGYPVIFPLGGATVNTFGMGPQLAFSNVSYFANDTWTPSLKFSAFGNFWVQRNQQTAATNFDPRLTFVYRPDSADVVRLTGGRATSDPAPALDQPTPLSLGAPSSLNPVCGPGNLNTVASVENPNLAPEHANDVELAYGHRFTPQTTIQADLYSSWENDAIYDINVPVTSVPLFKIPPSFLSGYLARIAQVCGGTPTIADLGYTIPLNAASARYQGINLTGTVGLTRHLDFNAGYVIQTGAYYGIPASVLMSNPTLINGSQIAGVPMRQGTAGLSLNESSGFAARIDANYMGGNNTFHRNPFWFSNASVSQTTGDVTINLGVYNLFNSIAQQYGFIGYGTYTPENQFGSDSNAFQQGSEQFGLPYRQVWFTAKFGVGEKPH
ncbi:MAG: TonB-dependent receptor [Candidatus Eremiobacteraeota bacterium]|nr:TonB-dependent receptor [Candidatus Eremiobacteraeota bacterium]